MYIRSIFFLFLANFLFGAASFAAVSAGQITSVSPSQIVAGQATTVTVKFKSTSGTGNVIIEADSWSSGWNVSPENRNPDINSVGIEYSQTFTVTPPSSGAGTGTIIWKFYDDGWGQHPNGSTQLHTKGHVIYIRHSVSFNKQGGAGGSGSVIATYGSAMPSATKPSRTGYTFEGYYTGTVGSGTKYYDSNMSSARNWDQTSNKTLYAKWVARTSSITFNKQGGSGGSSSVTATYGSSMPSASKPSRTGYTFEGYYTGTGGSGTKYYNSNMSSARNWDRTSNTTLYAKWVARTSSITFNKQGGSGGSSSVTATYGSSMPSASKPSRTGYTFEGYYTGTGGSGTKYYNSNMSSARNWDQTSNETLYAKWTVRTSSITFNKQGGSGGSSSVTATYGSSMLSASKPSRTGYTFEGYYTGTGGSGTKYYNSNMSSARSWNLTSNTTLYAYWTASSASISVTVQNQQGGSVAGAKVVRYDSGGNPDPSQRTTNAQGQASWSSLPIEWNNFEAYFEGANPFDSEGELWASKSVNLQPGGNSVTLRREWPYVENLRVYRVSDGSELPYGSQVVAGEELRIDATVRNKLGDGRNARVTFWADRSKSSSIDLSSTSSSQSVSAGSTRTISYTVTPSLSGSYFVAVKVETFSPTSNQWIKTDSWNWSNSWFTVVAAEASLTVTVQNQDGVARSGAKVVRYDENGNPDAEQKTTDSQGQAIWSGLSLEWNNFEAYFEGENPFDSDGELWASKSINLQQGANSVTLKRDWPYVESLKVFRVRDNQELGLGDLVAAGEQLRVEALVRNQLDESRSVRVTFWGDRNKDFTIDFSSTTAAASVSASSSRTFTYLVTPASLGKYHLAVKTETFSETSSQWIKTDSWSWSDSWFEIADLPVVDAEISEFLPIVTSVAPGANLTFDVELQNTGNQASRFWVGFSIKTPSAGEWPDGWLDVTPQQTIQVEPGQLHTETFNVQLPIYLEEGDYVAATSINGAYDPLNDLLDDRYDYEEKDSFTINLGEIDDLDPYGIRQLDPDPGQYFDNIDPRNRIGLEDLQAMASGAQELRVGHRNGRALSSDDENLIVIVHGWTDGFCDANDSSSERQDASRVGENYPSNLSALNRLYHSIINKPEVVANWSVIRYDWSNDAKTSISDPLIGAIPWQFNEETEPALCRIDYPVAYQSSELAARSALINPWDLLGKITVKAIDAESWAVMAAERSYQHGLVLADALVQDVGSANLKRVHLIAHSAGSWAIFSAARYLRANVPNVEIQITYLDPFIPDEGIVYIWPVEHSFMTSHTLRDSISNASVSAPSAYRAEAYYTSNDETELPFNWVSNATTVTWEWDLSIHRAVTLDTTFGQGNWSDYGGHSGPIDFYTASTNTSFKVGNVYYGFSRSISAQTEFNKPPNQLEISHTSVMENQSGNTQIGSLSTGGPDIGDTFTYSLVNGDGSGDNEAFTIFNNSLLTIEPFDFETKNSYSIRIRTTDQDGLYFEKVFTISILNVNEPPVLFPISNKGVDEWTELSFEAQATDPDLPAQNLSYSLIGAPLGAEIGETNGLFSWTPTEEQGPNSYTFSVQVSDGELSDSKQLTVTVNEIAETYGLTLSAVNGAIAANPNATLYAEDTIVELTPQPANGYGFSHWSGDASGSDDPLSITMDFNKSITAHFVEVVTNIAPVLNAIGNQSVDELVELTFTASATDSDEPAQNLTYSLTNEPAGAVIDPVTGVFTWTPNEAQGPDSYTFTVSVSDGELDDSEEITVTVNEVNAAPVLAAIGDQNATAQSKLSFTAMASDLDLPAQNLTYSLSDEPTGATIDSATGVFVWTPTEAQSGGIYTFTVRVSDGVLMDFEEITVTVSGDPDQLIINPSFLNNYEFWELTDAPLNPSGSLTTQGGVLSCVAINGSNYSSGLTQSITFNEQYENLVFSFDWKVNERETPNGLTTAQIRLFDSDDEQIGFMVALNSGQTFRTTLAEHYPGWSEAQYGGVYKRAEAFDWENVELATSEYIPEVDIREVVRVEVIFNVYNDAGAGGDLFIRNASLIEGGKKLKRGEVVVLEEGFDGYTSGALTGQGGWSTYPGRSSQNVIDSGVPALGNAVGGGSFAWNIKDVSIDFTGVTQTEIYWVGYVTFSGGSNSSSQVFLIDDDGIQRSFGFAAQRVSGNYRFTAGGADSGAAIGTVSPPSDTWIEMKGEIDWTAGGLARLSYREFGGELWLPTGIKDYQITITDLNEIDQVFIRDDSSGSKIANIRVTNFGRGGSLIWTELTSFDYDTGSMATVEKDGEIYGFGGGPWSAGLSRCRAYNIANDEWRWISNTGFSRRYSATAVNLDGELYCVAGYSGYSGMSSVQVYDTDLDSWNSAASLNTNHGNGKQVVVADGSIYAMGGHVNNGVFTRANERYIPGSPDSWNDSLAPVPVDLRYGTMLSRGHLIYVFGGYAHSDYYNHTLIYDTQTDQWSSGADMPVDEFARGTAFELNGRIFVMGGRSSTEDDPNVYEYSPTSDQWSIVGKVPVESGLASFQSHVVDGAVYVMFSDTVNDIVRVFRGSLAQVSFDSWLDSYSRVPELLRDYNHDGDLDRLANIVEFYQGTSPADSSERGGIRAMRMNEDGSFGLEFQRNKDADGVIGTVKWSSDLKTWHEDGDSANGVTVTLAHPVQVEDHGDREIVEVKGAVTGGKAELLFFRIEVETMP